MIKSLLRQTLRDRRKSYVRSFLESHPGQSLPIENLLPFIQHILQHDGITPSESIIAGYWPSTYELDCRPLLAALFREGYLCALPCVEHEDQPLRFRAWQPGDPLELDLCGVPAPQTTQALRRPSYILVPLLGFDTQGHRLGQGSGYYDRTLSLLRHHNARSVRAIGLAFDCQEEPLLPTEPHDQVLDALITPTRLFFFKPKDTL